MAGRRLRSVGGPVLLTLAGAAAVTGVLPRMALSGSLPACITESSGTAWLGIHLSLLSQDPICPEGMFAPGAHYAEIARFSVVLSLSALLAGVLILAGTLGVGFWARRAVRAARAWLHRRVGLPAVPTTPLGHPRPPLASPAAAPTAAPPGRLQFLRGPPVLVAA